MHAQDTQPPDALLSESPPHPSAAHQVFDHLSAAVTSAAVHDSDIGWYNVVSPTATYQFSPRYSADVAFSIYPYRLAPNPALNPPPTHRLISTYGEVSDVSLSVSAMFYPRSFQDQSTFTMTAPTGNRASGLGVGHVTFDANNYLQRNLRHGGLLLQTGVGDSSGLFNRLVPNQDNGLGPIAHFQTGFFVRAFNRSYLQTVAYEQIPIGDQKLYTSITRPGFPPQTVVSGRKVEEDNGFTTSIGIPLTSHLTLTSGYNRSLRLHLDTVSTGITFVFRGRPQTHLSLLDEALRTANASPK
jgi:hypothetical protein